MVEYIEREAISKTLEKMEIVGPLYYGIPVVEALDAIENMPAADVREVKRGKWIKTVGENGITSACRCNECGFEDNRYSLFNFCPNCGADMRSEPPKEEEPTCEDCQHECQMMGLDMKVCASYEPPEEK